MDAAQLTDTEPGEMPRGLCAWECLLMVVCIMLLKWVRHPGPELSHAASIGRVCQSLRND